MTQNDLDTLTPCLVFSTSIRYYFAFSQEPRKLLGNNPPLLRDKRALLIPNKKEAYPMIYPLYNVLQITTPSDSPFDPILGKS